jgi:hypothetical protein
LNGIEMATGVHQSPPGQSLRKPLRMSRPVGQQPDWHPSSSKGFSLTILFQDYGN